MCPPIIWNITAFLFVVFAYLQINDPDPILWIVVYLSNAILLALRARNIYKRIISVALLLIAGSGTLWLWPDSFVGFSGDMTNQPNIEYAREAVGLLLIAISQLCVVYSGESARSQSSTI